MKQEILQKALKNPFCDARFTKTEEGKTLLLLFAPYRTEKSAPREGFVRISAFYPAAQQAYLSASALVLELSGLAARLYHRHGLKKLAASSFGFQGKNTLFYHPVHGSFVAMQGIELDVPIEADEPACENRCIDCGACAKVCPVGAFPPDGFQKESCIRYHFGKPEIPPEYGRHLYQIMGCERCQDSCPANQHLPEIESTVHEYDLIEVLEEKHTKEIKTLIGANFGTRTRILNQAIYYAANKRYLPALPAIKALLGDEQAGAAARYAAVRLDNR